MKYRHFILEFLPKQFSFKFFLALIGVDTYCRYRETTKMIVGSRILDVGSGGKSLLTHLCTAEILSLDKEKLEGVDVIGSMDALPFQDNTFDTVICIDAIEHVPYAKRKKCLDELKRIAKFRVVLHHPIQDHYNYKGRVCDFWFNYWHQNVYGYNERNTQEHLRNVEPSFTEMRREGFRILGLFDAGTWIKLMYLQFLKAKPFGIILAWIYKCFNGLKGCVCKCTPKYFYSGFSIYDKLSGNIRQVLKESGKFSS